MIVISEKKLQNQLNNIGYNNIPFYAGICETCSRDSNTCKKRKMKMLKLKSLNYIKNVEICTNWELSETLLRKMASKKIKQF